MRRKLPKQKRPFRLPGGDIIPFLAFYSTNMIVYWAGWATNFDLMISILIGYVSLVAFQLTSKSPDRPKLDFTASAWVLPWLGVVFLVGWLFDPASHPNMLFWVFLINLVITAVIYVVAVKITLPTEKMKKCIEEAPRTTSKTRARPWRMAIPPDRHSGAENPALRLTVARTTSLENSLKPPAGTIAARHLVALSRGSLRAPDPRSIGIPKHVGGSSECGPAEWGRNCCGMSV